MIKYLTLAFVLLITQTAIANDSVVIQHQVLGGNQTGQSTQGFLINNQPGTGQGIFHAPQYMPNYPTAAVIWPRVVTVPCTKSSDGSLLCDGYKWTPDMGRGEYLFFTPVIKEAPQSVTCCQAPTIIYKEVPIKKGKE